MSQIIKSTPNKDDLIEKSNEKVKKIRKSIGDWRRSTKNFFWTIIT
jgi:hypothetical protein